MVSRRTLACNFLWTFFCMNDIENVEPIMVSSYFCPQNQNNAKNMSQIICQREGMTMGHSVKHPSKWNKHTDIVLLHRDFYLNLNRHIRHGRALTNIGFWSRGHKIPTGVGRKAECPGKHSSLEKRTRNRNSCFVTRQISNIGHILGRFK